MPVVYHGRTLTSKLPLSDALKAIAKYAFVASPYPLILSVEVHCDTLQQDRMAFMLRDILGPALINSPLPSDNASAADVKELPSPEALKHRILLKTKNLFETSKTEGVRPKLVTLDAESSESTSTVTTESGSDGGSLKRIVSSRRGGTQTPNREKAPMSFALAALIVYTIGVKCRGFNKKEHYDPYHVLSLGERRASKTIKEARSDLLDHNRNHLVRTYPAGTRVTSSNYLPQHLWVVGMQMVAINWQTFGALRLRSTGHSHLRRQIWALKSTRPSTRNTTESAAISSSLTCCARRTKTLKTRKCSHRLQNTSFELQ